MLEKIKGVFDFLNSGAKAWPIIISILGLILGILFAVGKFGSKNVFIGNVPLWLVFLVVTIASYPILKLAEYLIKMRSTKPLEYEGMLWKSSLFKDPIPYCPQCLREVVWRTINVKSVNSSINPMIQQVYNQVIEAIPDTYIYECPVHEDLFQTLMDIDTLTYEVKREMKWLKEHGKTG